MTQIATWIVPPNYQAIIYGYDAVEITARKAHLIKGGKRVASAFYKTKDANQDFAAWIKHIESNKGQ